MADLCLHTPRADCNNTVEWWEACCKEMSAISQHFENDAFCNDLLVACYTDIERELKGERIP